MNREEIYLKVQTELIGLASQTEHDKKYDYNVVSRYHGRVMKLIDEYTEKEKR